MSYSRDKHTVNELQNPSRTRLRITYGSPLDTDFSSDKTDSENVNLSNVNGFLKWGLWSGAKSVVLKKYIDIQQVWVW